MRTLEKLRHVRTFNQAIDTAALIEAVEFDAGGPVGLVRVQEILWAIEPGPAAPDLSFDEFLLSHAEPDTVLPLSDAPEPLATLAAVPALRLHVEEPDQAPCPADETRDFEGQLDLHLSWPPVPLHPAVPDVLDDDPPTPAEIREETRLIRESWSDSKRRLRAGLEPRPAPYEIPEVRTSERGLRPPR